MNELLRLFGEGSCWNAGFWILNNLLAAQNIERVVESYMLKCFIFTIVQLLPSVFKEMDFSLSIHKDVIALKALKNTSVLYTGPVLRHIQVSVPPPPTLLFDPCPSPAIATLCLKAMAFDSFSTNVKLIRIADLLGEQLLTEVKAFLKITLRFPKAFKFGVLQTVLSYTCVSKPASSPIITRTFFRSFEFAILGIQANNTRQIAA
ncbi:hypothetical protein pdam_00013246 [Pocillopora damicornis]|uniref:Uncharacterized protein n=1 Tax=Pocillopora damicornis TaxID=46731 RepID=A0A3M6TIF3_POCDA|nr:hypothetical protein pdam_00013246 [Pocillopora damicornis]